MQSEVSTLPHVISSSEQDHHVRSRLLAGVQNLVAAGIVLAAFIICAQLITQSRQTQAAKRDYAEANHIKYGLFSVNEWKNKLSSIVIHEIYSVRLSKANEREIKKHLERQLGGLIDEVASRIRRENESTAKGRFKQAFIDAFVDVNEIKKGIPGYADEIWARLSAPQTQRELRGVLKNKVTTLLDETFEPENRVLINDIMVRTGSRNLSEAKEKVRSIVQKDQAQVSRDAWILISLVAALFLWVVAVSRQVPTRVQYCLLLAGLFALFLGGVTTPMIDLEAKISEMSFVLFGQPVAFKNQVLYFQSKSIVDVFWIMLNHPELQMKAVGIAMVCFSIVFPILKTVSSLLYHFNLREGRENKWVRFFALKSGKWAMADVLVVAIFMAYIGFNGIINSQLKAMSTTEADLTLLTTNGTALQPGFFVFLTYVILAIALSSLMKLSRNETVTPA